MFRRFSVNFAIISILMDLFLVFLCLYASSYLRPILNSLPFTQIIDQPVPLPISIYIVFAITWVAIFLLFSVYDGRRNLYITDEFTSLTLGSILASISLAGILYFSFRDISRVLFLSFALLTFLSMAIWRRTARIVFRNRKAESYQNRRVLIIGAGPVGQDLADKINNHPYLGLKLSGFLDDNPEKWGNNVLGGLESVRSTVKRKKIDDVVISLPRRAFDKVNRLVSELHDLPVKVWVIPDYFHLALHKANVIEFAGIPMLDLRAPALNEYQRMIKRIFDLVITFISLPISFALMGIIAFTIRIDSPGPIFFRQKRVGENGRIFKMYKFRSMVQNAEELRNSVEHFDNQGRLIHKTENDPRITRVGRLLRQTSMDELPQILNILKGEMSLIGPRPEMPYLVEMYEPWQRTRFAVPQGLTGWWQVNGRSDKPMHLHTEDDLYYVQNYSLWLDLKILLKTILVVLRGSGAY